MENNKDKKSVVEVDFFRPRKDLVQKLETLAQTELYFKRLFKLINGGHRWTDALSVVLIMMHENYTEVAGKIDDLIKEIIFPTSISFVKKDGKLPGLKDFKIEGTSKEFPDFKEER